MREEAARQKLLERQKHEQVRLSTSHVEGAFWSWADCTFATYHHYRQAECFFPKRFAMHLGCITSCSHTMQVAKYDCRR